METWIAVSPREVIQLVCSVTDLPFHDQRYLLTISTQQ